MNEEETIETCQEPRPCSPYDARIEGRKKEAIRILTQLKDAPVWMATVGDLEKKGKLSIVMLWLSRKLAPRGFVRFPDLRWYLGLPGYHTTGLALAGIPGIEEDFIELLADRRSHDT